MFPNISQLFDKFATTWLGKPLEAEDPSNLDQCFDEAFAWIDVLGIPREAIRHLHAYQIWTVPNDLTRRHFEMIPNTPTGVPQKGDVVVFGQGVGVSGHVSIASGKGDTKTFQSLDQNWGGHKFVEYVTHNYDLGPVLGWLRPKPMTAMISIPTTERDFLVGRSSVAKEVATYLELTNPDTAPAQDYKNVIGGYKSRVTDLGNQLAISLTEQSNRIEQVARLKVECQAEKDLRLAVTDKLNEALKVNSQVTGVFEGQLAEKQGVIDALARDKGELNQQIAALQLELKNLKEKATGSLSVVELLTLALAKLIGR